MKHKLFTTSLVAIIVLVLTLALWAGGGSTDVHKEGRFTAYWSGQSDDAKFGSSAALYRVRNNQGGATTAGYAVELDGTAITVVTAASAAASMTVADTLADESGVFWVTVNADPDTAGNVVVTGTDENGVAQVGNIACTVSATSDTYVSTDLWASVTAVNSSGIETTSTGVAVYAYPHMTVNLVDATTDVMFGVVVCGETQAAELRRAAYVTGGVIADNAEGFVSSVWKGPVQIMAIHAGGNAAILPGDTLNLKADGAWDEDSATPDYFTQGIAIQPGATTTSTLIWAFIK